MNDKQFLAGMWQKAELLRCAEAEQAEAQKRSRVAAKQFWRRSLLYAAAALGLLVLCVLAMRLTGHSTLAALVPAVYLPFCAALFWDGRLFSDNPAGMNGKGASTQ